MMLCVLCVSCHETEWDAPDFGNGVPYGNNQITEDNVISIAQLKAKYPNYAGINTCIEITEDIKLRVCVTGNDIQGNLYNSIAVQDENGDALIVSISGSDLYARLPVGQEILIDLNGLSFGCNASQPQLGTPYTSNYGISPGRMNKYVWESHVRIMGKVKPEMVIPIDFPSNPTLDDAGKLMTIRNVTVTNADGKTLTWAAGSSGSVKNYFDGYDKDVYIIYTSTYSDFANTPIPAGKMNLTGIWKVYKTSDKYALQWELIIRDANDIEILETEKTE